MNYCKVNCDELKFECKTLKQHSNKMENYSRRKNLVIRGISEEKNESSVICEEKVREFIKNKLKLHNDTVDAMKFAGCSWASPGFGSEGGAKNFFFQICEFACREAPCCAWRIAMGGSGACSPENFF